MGFFNRYPLSNFHELNADWLIDQVKDLLTSVDEMDTRLSTVEDTVTGLDTRLTTVEGDIDALQDAGTDHENRLAAAEADIDELQVADIQDAEMLSGVGSVSAGASNVSIAFPKKTYQAGSVDTESTETAIIPAATQAAAGVMLPAEKAKLEAFTVDGSGNVNVSGEVFASSPTASGALATKSYVDSLAISGSASVTTDTAPLLSDWAENGQTESESLGYARVYSYGKAASIRAFVTKELAASHIAGTSVFECRLKAGYGGGFIHSTYMLDSSKNMIPCRVQMDASNWLRVISDVALTAGTELSFYLDIPYIIID